MTGHVRGTWLAMNKCSYTHQSVENQIKIATGLRVLMSHTLSNQPDALARISGTGRIPR